jgi:hypothetical protein
LAFKTLFAVRLGVKEKLIWKAVDRLKMESAGPEERWGAYGK